MEAAANAEGAPIEPRKPKKPADGGPPRVSEERRAANESRRRLARLRASGEADVTSTRVAVDARESERREEAESRRAALRERRDGEAEASAARDAEVEQSWSRIFADATVPTELRDALEAQRKACDEVIAAKDAMADEIREELKLRDEGYVKALKRQAEDVDALVATMRARFGELKAASLDELEATEAQFLERREALLESNAAELDALLKQRAEAEAAFVEATAERSEAYAEELEKHRADDAEEYNILKIRLETDVQNLEQHLGAMRATYQLNTEKLEYNYRVLVERDHENQTTMQQQRKKIAKQRERLMHLKQRHAEAERKSRAENVKLLEEHRRTTEAFKDLQTKHRHFKRQDAKKFQEVWAMNEEAVMSRVKRALDADRVLHEQQLGWRWHAPNPDVFMPPEELALDAARKKKAAVREAAARARAEAIEAGEDPGPEPEASAASGAGAEGDENPFAKRLADPSYRLFLEAIADEVDFLVDAAAMRTLVAAEAEAKALEEAGEAEEAAVTRAAASALKVETVLKSLGVEDAPAFDGLAAALVAEGADAAAEAAAKRDVADVMVERDEIIPRLVAFAESERSAGGATALAQLKAAGEGEKDGERDGSPPAPRKTKEELEAEYWSRMANAVGPKTTRVWSALERGLERYREVLARRRDALDETRRLGEQNAELRALLNQYLSSQINAELQVPPTALV